MVDEAKPRGQAGVVERWSLTAQAVASLWPPTTMAAHSCRVITAPPYDGAGYATRGTGGLGSARWRARWGGVREGFSL